MNRMMAIVEREMRKFFRSPALMLASMIFPLVQLIILGNAFGGKIHDVNECVRHICLIPHCCYRPLSSAFSLWRSDSG